MIGVVIFALSSATAGLAVDTTSLIASRIVQGVGAALMMPATLSIVTDAFPAHERGKAMGTWAGVSALALAVGPVLGGFLTEHVSWRAIFYLNIPVAIGAVIAALFAVRESRDTTVGRDVDYLGVGALTVTLTALVLALVEGNAWGWGSPAIVGLLVGGAIGLAAFVAIELRVKVPMVEFQFFTDRNFLGAVVVALIVSFAMLGVFFFLALYMQNILGYSALEAGLRFLPLDPDDRGRRADRRPPRRPVRPALADRRRAWDRRGLALHVQRDRRRLDLRRPAAGLRAARHRHRDDDVADDERRDECRRGREGRDRLRSPLDVPDGRRQPRRRRDRRDLPELGRRPDDGDPVQEFVDALGFAMSVSAAIAFTGAVIAAVAIRAKKRAISPVEAETALAIGPDPADRASVPSRP